MDFALQCIVLHCIVYPLFTIKAMLTRGVGLYRKIQPYCSTNQIVRIPYGLANQVIKAQKWLSPIFKENSRLTKNCKKVIKWTKNKDFLDNFESLVLAKTIESTIYMAWNHWTPFRFSIRSLDFSNSFHYLFFRFFYKS